MNRRLVLAWKLWERSRKASMVQAWRWPFPQCPGAEQHLFPQVTAQSETQES